MSLEITMNKIYLTKGDTARFSISLVSIPGVAQEYTLSDIDQVYFIVTDAPHIVRIADLEEANSCIFYKSGTSIVIDPEDTENLESGVYYYQVRVILAVSGDTNTVIEPEEFHITPDDNVYDCR